MSNEPSAFRRRQREQVFYARWVYLPLLVMLVGVIIFGAGHRAGWW